MKDEKWTPAMIAAIEWTPELLAVIPDDVLYSERQRRRARQRSSYTGGALWKKHNPNEPRCRCAKCTERRRKNREKALGRKRAE